ncbi:hypothetical protein [Methylobacterium persicinum]|uniref:Toxin-antitoxin system n=1 Tax=Methylobacterium persicinum TaxID=374426 RepID=A0ABU0HU03_9HYPH|nr:hypothetical protein [Methylobacterium persicinum]MDQ0445210.1 hypothetical protein [Methylobacterium persicinum]
MMKKNVTGPARSKSMRLSTKIQEQVASSAERHGLSLTQEVDLRLRASFGDVWARRVLALDEVEPTSPRIVRSA